MTANIVNLQVLAEPAIARDQANGTHDARRALDDRHYMWHGPEQTIPMGMDGDPEGFAAGLRRALPLADTLRLPFNLASFNPDGSLHDQYERFLTAAAREGFRIVFVQNEGLAQRSGQGDHWTPDSLATHLDTVVMPRLTAAWTALDAWLDRHAQVRAVVWGYELVNEPAAWARGEPLAPWGAKQATLDRFVALYARHMEALAAATGADNNDRILIGGWGYSGTFAELARPVVDGVTALDHLTTALGDRLIWSAHLYPGWHGTDRLDPDAILARLDEVYAPVRGRPVLLTEFNLNGAAVNDTTDTGQVAHLFGRMQEWFADRGLGMGWFPGAEAGGSSLVTIDRGGALRFLHQHSYAFAMNAFTLDDSPPGTDGHDLVSASLIAGRLRNEPTDADYDPLAPFDPVRGFGLAAGYGGQDTLVARDDANGLLYGGTAGDLLIGGAAEDFLFGQSGHDVLIGREGRDFLYGGRGDDRLFGGDGDDVQEGGEGADTFVADAGTDIIVDFNPSQGDRISFGHRHADWASILAGMTRVAHDGPLADDLRIVHGDGTATLMLNMADRLEARHVLLPGTSGVIDVTDGQRVSPGFIDLDGDVFGTDSHDVLGHAGADHIRGTNTADTLRGGGGADLLEGRGGKDVLVGGDGNDTLFGGGGSDSLHLDKGSDTAFGGPGNDRFHTGNDASTMLGDSGKDRFYIRADSHGHLISGGQGADQFHFTALGGGSGARITDFDPAEDRLLIDGARIVPHRLPEGMSLLATDTGSLLQYAEWGAIHLDGLFL